LVLLLTGLPQVCLPFTIFFYAVVYTVWLKRSTPQNIVIGGACWCSAASHRLGLRLPAACQFEPLLLFAIIFMWTPPHFWALALVKNDDYKAANIPMLPVVSGSLETRRQIVIYAVLLAPLAVVPSFIGMASVGYGVIAALAGLLFVAMSLQLFKTGDHETCDAAVCLFNRVFIPAVFRAGH
jgi:protoheme IX farnesyltransferase